MDSHTPITIVFDPGMTLEEMTVRSSPVVADDLRSQLEQRDIHVSDVLELSQPVEVLTTIAVLIGSGGVGAILGPVLGNILQRHKDRTIRLRVHDVEFEMTGYSQGGVERFLEILEVKRIANAEGWSKWMAERQLPECSERAPETGTDQPGGDQDQ